MLNRSKFYILVALIVFCSSFGRQVDFSISDSAKIYSDSATNLKKIRHLDKALEAANKSVLYARKSNKHELLAESYYTLGNIQIEIKNYNSAIESLLRSVSYTNSLKPTSLSALAYYNLGICYLRQDKFEKAENYFEKANSIFDNLSLFDAKNMVNLEKANVYLEREKLPNAEKTLKEIILNLKTDNNNKILPEVYYLLGIINYNSKQYTIASNHLFKSYKLSQQHKDVSQELKTAKKLSETYEKLALTNNSIFYLKRYIKLKDSIGTNEIQGFMSNKAKVGDVLRSMEKLDKEKKEQERANKFSKLINILSIALITILSLLSLSLYRNNIIRNKSNELLQEKNKELEDAKERIEKASQARAEFLSTVSHELRTPLNAINGISHILLDDNPKESQIEYLKSLKFSGNYLLTYINDILEINRIESNNIEVEKINFDVKELLQNIHNSFKELASQNNNDFNLTISEEVPTYLIGDPTKLSQILINLINNALKFTNNGDVSVRVNTITTKKKICKINFVVSDTGIGIPLEKQEQIFESFSQGSVEINRKYGGTGLGLTIVKKLIDLMHGKIELKSIPNQGATFTFSLDFPLGIQQDKNISKNLIVDEAVFIDKNILLVEDNKINQMITKKIVEKKQMKVALCETGEDAIEMMRNNTYDLVLMDVHLPGINGTIATEEIRKFDTTTPIIALTAISLNENREMLMSFGMNDVITKPFNPDVFYKTIEINLIQHANS